MARQGAQNDADRLLQSVAEGQFSESTFQADVRQGNGQPRKTCGLIDDLSNQLNRPRMPAAFTTEIISSRVKSSSCRICAAARLRSPATSDASPGQLLATIAKLGTPISTRKRRSSANSSRRTWASSTISTEGFFDR